MGYIIKSEITRYHVCVKMRELLFGGLLINKLREISDHFSSHGQTWNLD